MIPLTFDESRSLQVYEEAEHLYKMSKKDLQILVKQSSRIDLGSLEDTDKYSLVSLIMEKHGRNWGVRYQQGKGIAKMVKRRRR